MVILHFENKKWLCNDCINSLIKAIENIEKYAGLLRKKLYGTELSFTPETKNNEIPKQLSKDDDYPWFYICLPTILYQIESGPQKYDGIDSLLSNKTYMDRGNNRFWKLLSISAHCYQQLKMI
eukprot:416244_1